jgi:F0F1-type ATP synthase assembly protein I
MMVLFVLLGAAAGTANVVRTASGYDASVGFRQPPGDGEKEDDGDHGGPRHKD